MLKFLYFHDYLINSSFIDKFNSPWVDVLYYSRNEKPRKRAVQSEKKSQPYVFNWMCKQSMTSSQGDLSIIDTDRIEVVHFK